MALIVTIPAELPVTRTYMVTTKAGIILRDGPMSQTDGSQEVGRAPHGKILYGYLQVNTDFVPYALVKIQGTMIAGWVRLQEKDGNTVYVTELPAVVFENEVAQAIKEGLMAIAAAIANRK